MTSIRGPYHPNPLSRSFIGHFIQVFSNVSKDEDGLQSAVRDVTNDAKDRITIAFGHIRNGTIIMDRLREAGAEILDFQEQDFDRWIQPYSLVGDTRTPDHLRYGAGRAFTQPHRALVVTFAATHATRHAMDTAMRVMDKWLAPSLENVSDANDLPLPDQARACLSPPMADGEPSRVRSHKRAGELSMPLQR